MIAHIPALYLTVSVIVAVVVHVVEERVRLPRFVRSVLSVVVTAVYLAQQVGK